ncbi:hypothetical protein K1719_038104 [Acacia pycnantha]|nr:hypothetical protein K1719_038104 [Acacia pycnantha]
MLKQIGNGVEDPWLLAGDFNEIKTLLEHKGGGRINDLQCRRFGDWIQQCNLIDLDTNGPFSMWKGPEWEGLDKVYKRLDRCLCNVKWHETFEAADIRVVLRLCLDHHPILVSLNPEQQGNRERMFRYEAMWQMHGTLNQSTTLQGKLSCWNREVFGKIAYHKRRLFNRLNGIQKNIERWSNLFLIRFENELEEELMATLWQEEILR